MEFDPPNFLTCPMACQLSDKPIKKRTVPRLWPYFLIIILLGLVASATPLVLGGYIAAQAATRLRATLQTVQAQVQAQELVRAGEGIDAAKLELKDLHTGLQTLGFWRNAPYLKDYIAAFDQAEVGGEQTLAGLEELLGVARSIQETLSLGSSSLFDSGIAPTQTFKTLTPDDKRKILAKLNESLPRMRLAKDKLLEALTTMKAIRSQNLYQPLQQGMDKAVAQFETMYRSLDEGIYLAEILLPMAGYPQPKNYLVVLQNAEELRPTGGFIGNVGYARIDAGDITDLWVKDVYSLDNPVSKVWNDPSPYPIQHWLEQKYLFFRDSNWSPDFPTTAARLMDVYAREQALANVTSTPLDGVVALEPGFFKDLLQLTGPIQIEDKTFTADNFFDEMEYDVEVGFLKEGRPRPQRKELVAKVGDALVQKVKDIPSKDWPKLLDLATKAFEHKDVMIYVNDPATLKLLDERHWSNRTLATVDDYLWVVDCNMAAMKTDGVMDKQIIYQLETASSSGAIATVRLHYFNTNPTVDWRYTRYRDYVRVYVPEGSTLIESQGAMADDKLRSHGQVVPGTVDVMNDLGKTVFGTFWAIEPGETRDLVFKYRLPPTTAANPQTYQLIVQRQPGSNTHLTLDLRLGKNVVAATPAEASTDYGDSRYRLDQPLDKDVQIEVQFSKN